MFCNKCGKEVKEGNAFCTECGAPVKEEPEAAAIQPSPPPPATQSSPPPQTPTAPVPPVPGAPEPGLPAFAAPPPLLPPKKKHTGLIIGIAALAVVIVAVVLVLVLVVFSSDTGQAKKLLGKTEPIMSGLTTKGATLGTDLDTLLNDVPTMQSTAQYEAAADKIRAQAKEINKGLDQSQSYMNQMQKLNGVAAYKELASVISDLIRTDKKEMIQVTDFLDYISEQFKAVDAGKSVDSNAVAQRTSEFVSKLKALGAQAQDLKDKAEKIKADKNL